MEITLGLLTRVFKEEEHNMRGINYPFIDMAFGNFGSVSVGNTYRATVYHGREYGTNIETEDMSLPEKNTYYDEKYWDELDSRRDARETYRKKWEYYN